MASSSSGGWSLFVAARRGRRVEAILCFYVDHNYENRCAYLTSCSICTSEEGRRETGGMFLCALVVALASSSLLYLATPRMPIYRVTSLRPASFPRLSSQLELSATFKAGLLVTNANFLGVDVHGAAFDIFYEDFWGADLSHIGMLRDTRTVDVEAATVRGMRHAGGSLFVDAASVSTLSSAPAQHVGEKIMTVGPRDTVSSEEDAMSVFLSDVAPGTSLRMIYDALSSSESAGIGSVDVLTSGVIHVKAPRSPAFMLGIVCDNRVDLLSIPWGITGKDCVVEGVYPGWEDTVRRTERLKEKIMRMYNDGTIFDYVRRAADSDKEGNIMIQNDAFLEWNAF